MYFISKLLLPLHYLNSFLAGYLCVSLIFLSWKIGFLQNVHQQHSEVQKRHISNKKEQAGGGGELTQDNFDSSVKTGFNGSFAVQNGKLAIWTHL